MGVKLFHKLYSNPDSEHYLIILHGLFGMLDNWHNMARNLSELINVVTVDQRNHGHSPHTEHMDFASMAEDLKELLDDLGIERASVLGHSMGGKTAMVFASMYPECLEKLIVADIAPRAYQGGHQLYFKAFKEIDFSQFNRRKEADEAFAQYETSIPIRQFLLKNLERDKEGYTLKFNLDPIIAFYPKMIDALHFQWIINQPALFIHGGRSGYVTEADKDEILETFPLAEFVEIPEAGHWLHAEKPEAFFNAVKKFLLA